MRRGPIRIVLALILLGPCWAARAAPTCTEQLVAGRDAPAYAEACVQAATRAFREGRYEQAAAAFARAYALDPVPILRFNLAQAYRRGGRPRLALDTYQLFLKEDPTASLRGETEGYIQDLTVLLVEQERAERERRRPLYKKGWFWGVLAASAVAAGGISLAIGLSLRTPDQTKIPGVIEFK